MASPLRAVSAICKFSSIISRCTGCQSLQFSTSHRLRENEDQNHRVPPVRVGMSSDNSTVLCWHPEPTHPYEFTKPLPRKKDIAEGDSVLKVQLLKEEQLKFRPDGPTHAELTRMTHTTKHRWYPKPGKKYRKRNPPKDRDSI